ncbi:hypothetical protein HNQ56_000696 [Anaerotaenia torta]
MKKDKIKVKRGLTIEKQCASVIRMNSKGAVDYESAAPFFYEIKMSTRRF